MDPEGIAEAVADAVEDAVKEAQEEATDDAAQAAQAFTLSDLAGRLAAAEDRLGALEASGASYAPADHEHDLPEALSDLAAAVDEAVAELPEAVAEAVEEATEEAASEAEPLPGQVDAAESEVADEATEEHEVPDQAPHIAHPLFRRFGHRG